MSSAVQGGGTTPSHRAAKPEHEQLEAAARVHFPPGSGSQNLEKDDLTDQPSLQTGTGTADRGVAFASGGGVHVRAGLARLIRQYVPRASTSRAPHNV